MARKQVSFIATSNYSPKIFKRTLSLFAVRALLVLAGFLILVVIGALILAGSGMYRLARLSYLEHRNSQLEAEFAKMSALRQRLDRLEKQEKKMAEMLGVELTPPPVDWIQMTADSLQPTAETSRQVWGSRSIPSLVPLEDYVISRGFSSSHKAIDLAAQQGTPVRAAADGIVTGRGTDTVFGKSILLGHFQGYESYYGHFEEWKVVLGDTVRAGQIIGTVGSTGRSSAPHLHFEIRKDRKRIDPATLVKF